MQQVVSRETHGPLHSYTFRDMANRAKQLANALQSLGLKPASVVGSIAWNNYRHLESYYGVSGAGMVMHTCNPRLHPDQLAYIINHAEDEAVLFDSSFAPLIKAVAPQCSLVKHWICLSDKTHASSVEGVDIKNYEDLIAPFPAVFDWPDLDENSGAALCYTSGTTGNPKGVMYSHRAIALSALSACLPNVLNISSQETVLPVVPMFHINAWCLPYACLIAGAKLVLPGPKLDGASLYELMESEKVTLSAGVPTIWMGLIEHLEKNQLTFTTMRRTGTTFSLSAVRFFLSSCISGHFATAAPAFLSGALEAVLLKVLGLVGKRPKGKPVQTHHILQAMAKDSELHSLLSPAAPSAAAAATP
jgi:fatty-acyl-CoA synthase